MVCAVSNTPMALAGLIIDAVKGKSIAKHPDNMVAGNKLAMENPLKDCIYTPAEVVDGTETLYGQQSIRVIGTTADNTHFIMWRLPDFSCETVQAVLQRRSASGEWETMSGSRLLPWPVKHTELCRREPSSTMGESPRFTLSP